MTTIYKADSIRIANYQQKLPTDIGRFRPTPHTHELRAIQLDTGLWACSLPFGSVLGGEYGSPQEAMAAGLEWAASQGWTQDASQAQADSIQHARSRKNAHPNR